MRIGEVAQMTGLDVETVRFYEKTGLLPAPARRGNGYRTYGAEHLERLAFIRHCRSLDMSLADIRRLLELLEKPATECTDANVLVRTQLERVRARIASLTALERQLQQLDRRCSSPANAAHCGILAELVHAAHGEACVCHSEKAPVPQLG
jgi:Cd(II)/Pb(II)-responsive transcriptional regulator